MLPIIYERTVLDLDFTKLSGCQSHAKNDLAMAKTQSKRAKRQIDAPPETDSLGCSCVSCV
eukprot:COSAG06_NODE_237_length_19433_cov_92.613961_15_plen_61_part_00